MKLINHNINAYSKPLNLTGSSHVLNAAGQARPSGQTGGRFTTRHYVGSLFYYILILLLTLNFDFAFADFPQFYRENVEVTINDSIVEVHGIYYLFNNELDDIKIILAFPFSMNPYISYPIKINVIDNKTKKQIAYKKLKNCIMFPVFVAALDSTILKINYTQKCFNNTFEYIVTSTRQWGKSLELAEFTIKVKNSLKIINHSYAFDNKIKNQYYTVYYFKKENFFPNQNIKLNWERR